MSYSNSVINSTHMPPKNSTGLNPEQGSVSPLESKLLLSYYAILIVLTVAGNTLVCVAIYVDRRLRSPTNWFIASLAVSDLLYGLAGLSFRIASLATSMPRAEICAVWIWADMVCAAASMANLAVISVDRYLKITKPFSYDRNMTKKRSFVAIACVWIYAATLATFAIVKWPGATGVAVDMNTGFCLNDNKVFYTVANTVAFLFPLLVLSASYIMIFRTALIQFNKMKHMIVSSNNRDERHKQRSVVRDFKATKTLAIVLGTFTVCWAPFFLLFTVSLYKWDYMDGLPEAGAKAVFIVFYLILPNLNSACNPVIYAYFNVEFRRAFRKIVWSACEDRGSRAKYHRRRSSMTSFFQSTFVGMRRASPQNHATENNNHDRDDESLYLNGTTITTEV